MVEAARADGASTPPIRLVIFDFDGTLSDSGDWFLSVIDQLARRFNFRTVAPDQVEMLRHKSSREVIDFLGISRWKMPLIARHLRKLVGRNAHEIELFPGTPDLLERLADTGVKIALVTSNSEANARKSWARSTPPGSTSMPAAPRCSARHPSSAACSGRWAFPPPKHWRSVTRPATWTPRAKSVCARARYYGAMPARRC